MVTGASRGPIEGESPRGTVYRFSSAAAETARKKKTMTRASLFTGGLLKGSGVSLRGLKDRVPDEKEKAHLQPL
jgi:hypothetical protein